MIGFSIGQAAWQLVINRMTVAGVTCRPSCTLNHLRRHASGHVSGGYRTTFPPIYYANQSSNPQQSLHNFRRLSRANSTLNSYASAGSSNGEQDSDPSPKVHLEANALICSDHMPSLPVPQLSKTLEMLKETIWPIAMNSGEFANALDLIDAFSGSAGQKLDLLLRTKANQTKNWLTHDWWVEEIYLKSRSPLVINSNPAMIYPQLPFAVTGRQQLVSTVAGLISGIIDYKLALEQGHNPEAPQKGFVPSLCYNQYSRIFGYTRMPGELIDSVVISSELTNHQQFNLVCAHRGRFFEIKLDNIEDENRRLETLNNILNEIMLDTSSQETEGLGLLTTSRRSTWSETIKFLNTDALKSIQDAHLMVSLDRIPTETQDSFLKPLFSCEPYSQQYSGSLLRQVLHGDRANVGNRWFDKSLQLIVVADEAGERFLGAGLNYEHSVAEAMVVTKMIEHSYEKTVVYAKTKGLSGVSDQALSSNQVSAIRQLQMASGVNGVQLGTCVARAKQDFISNIDQFDLAYFDYTNYGCDMIKSWHLSPDSWFQVALQLAHYRLHKRLGPCYESASTRRFAYGRTETIRSLTKDVAQFCQEPNYETLVEAIQSHKNYAIAANNAAAIDRTLLGYRITFNELRVNEWSWGVPTFETNTGDGRHKQDGSSVSKEQLLIKFDSLESTQSKQQVDINDLFTEEELNIIGAFFNNELFERSKKFALSTSQVSSQKHPNISMCYGPLVADGYGCCYNISGHQIVAAITANSSNQSFSCEVDKFSDSLRNSLDKMRDIVESRQSDVQDRRHQHES